MLYVTMEMIPAQPWGSKTPSVPTQLNKAGKRVDCHSFQCESTHASSASRLAGVRAKLTKDFSSLPILALKTLGKSKDKPINSRQGFSLLKIMEGNQNKEASKKDQGSVCHTGV